MTVGPCALNWRLIVGFRAVVSSFEKGVSSARFTAMLGGSHFFQERSGG